MQSDLFPVNFLLKHFQRLYSPFGIITKFFPLKFKVLCDMNPDYSDLISYTLIHAFTLNPTCAELFVPPPEYQAHCSLIATAFILLSV